MKHRLALLSLIVSVAGCREFGLPPPPTPEVPLRAIGVACASGADCASSFCVEGVCCERTCEEWESCIAQNRLGVCTARDLGTACVEDSKCRPPPGEATGHCVEGVCCERVCASWESCTLAKREGTCVSRRLGEGCDRDADCPPVGGDVSGHCVEGVCCERACASWESCTVEKLEGTCVPSRIGDACQADAECPPVGDALSGHCVEGYCCERACASWESCAVEDREGTCVSSQIGDACAQDADCPPVDGDTAGHCADGVCCRTACKDGCWTCAASGAVGTCVLAADNTDPRNDCVHSCQTCFSGRCGPALVGTQAKCSGQQACGEDGLCRELAGGPCASDDDCALGHCVDGRCLVNESIKVTAVPMTTNPRYRDVRDVAINAYGEVAVLFSEYTSSSGYSQNDLVLAKSVGSEWNLRTISDDAEANPGDRPASAVFFDRILYTASGLPWVQGCDAPGSTVRCGLVGQLVAPDGRPSAVERIDAGVTPGWVKLVVDGEGTLFAVYVDLYRGINADTGIGLYVLKRTRDDASWKIDHRVLVTDENVVRTYTASQRMNTVLATAVPARRGLTVLYVKAGDPNHVPVAWTWDGVSAPVSSETLPPSLPGDDYPCWPTGYLFAQPTVDASDPAHPDAESIIFSTRCWGSTIYLMLGTYTPVTRKWTLDLLLDGTGTLWTLQPLASSPGHTLFAGLHEDFDGRSTALTLSWMEGTGAAATWKHVPAFSTRLPVEIAKSFVAASFEPGSGTIALTHGYTQSTVPAGFSPDLYLVRYRR